MHYIRFLKLPKVVKGHRLNDTATLAAKITITTDLGESFLAIDTDILVDLVSSKSNKILSGKAKMFAWKGKNGMRILDVSMPISVNRDAENECIQMVVYSREKNHRIGHLEDVLTSSCQKGDIDDDSGGVVSVRSGEIKVAGNEKQAAGMEERVLQFRSDARIHIWEETGHSIARHIWDAGLVLSSYLASSFAFTPSSHRQQITSPATQNLARLPILEHVLSQPGINVLELGAGCGIVGITLAHMIAPRISQILLTDLEDASEILSRNISSYALSSSTNLSQQILDWASPLPANVQSTIWNLVVVSDCTYNPDVVPDLVATLKSLARINREVVILLAMKIRHDSELVFFELMEQNGLLVKERLAVPLSVLGGGDEEIDILIFGTQF